MTALPRPLRLPVPTTRVRERALLAALVGVLLLAGGLRVAAATGPHGPLSADERAYGALAAGVAAGERYGEGLDRPLHWAPGAPVAFGVAQRVAGGDPLRAVRGLQIVLGLALVLLTFGLGTAVAGRGVGLAAAAGVAVYPPLVELSSGLLSEGLGTTLVAGATLATVLAAKRRAAWWAWAGAGALWGAAVLTRADLVPAPFLIAAVLAVAAIRPRRRTPEAGEIGDLRGMRGGFRSRAVDTALLRGGAMLLAGFAVAVAPWSAYASSRAGTVVPVTTGGGAALFVGSYLPGGGTTIGAKRALAADIAAEHPGTLGAPASTIPAGLMLDTVAERHPGLPRDAAIAREARFGLARHALGDPVAYGTMTLDKLRRMWLAPSRAGGGQPGPLTALLHPVAVLAAFALALLALWRTRSLGLALLLAPVATSLLVHAVVVANPRYALVALPPLVVAGLAGARQAAAGATAPASSRTQRDVYGIRRLSARSR